ncbi:MAG: sulfite exporter TauE/SafE family protein [Sulfolobales archaeon]
MIELLAPMIGLLAGTLGSMFGLGGGFLMVPLLNIAGVSMKIAVGTSATAIFFNAISATIAYARYGYIAYRAGLLISITATVSAYLGALLTRYIDVDTLRIIFGVVLLLVATRVAVMREKSGSSQLHKTIQWDFKKYMALLGGGILAGLASGLLGVGGGVVNVPLLTYLGAVMHVAVATSSMAITLTSVSSAITHYTLGNIDVVLLALLVPTLIVGAQIGARIARRAKSQTLRRGFAIVLAFIAVRMVLKGLGYQIP